MVRARDQIETFSWTAQPPSFFCDFVWWRANEWSDMDEFVLQNGIPDAAIANVSDYNFHEKAYIVVHEGPMWTLSSIAEVVVCASAV